MIKCKCIYKYRDNQGNIKGYRLQDTNNQVIEVSSEELKNMIRCKRVDVINLTLTSDNRLMSTVEKQPNLNITANKAASAKKDSFSKYSDISRYVGWLEGTGIDIVGSFFMAIPKDGERLNDTYHRTFRNYDDLKLPENIMDLDIDPSPLFGTILDSKELNIGKGYSDQHGYYDDDIYKYVYSSKNNKYESSGFFARELDILMPVLILHKNGGYRTVMFCDMRYNVAAAAAVNMNYSETILTMSSDGNVQTTNVGKKISDKERHLIVKRLLTSTISSWENPENVRKFAKSIDRKDFKIKAASAGISAAGVPLIALAALVAIPFAYIMEMTNFTAEESIANFVGGPIAVSLLRNSKNNNE